VSAGLDVCDAVGMTINATAQSGALPGNGTDREQWRSPAAASEDRNPGNARQTDSYVITVANQKGGIGKTMVALSLAAHTAAAYGRALVVDVDPQASAYDLTQLMQDPGYDVVHELDPVQLTRIRQLRNYDTILVDCPGSLEGHDVLAEVLARSTYVIIPYDHEPESVLPTIRTAERVKSAGVPYAAVVTKADPRLGAEFIIDAWNTLAGAGVRHFRGVIREYRAWPNSLRAGVPITRWHERYAPKVREDIAGLHTELLLEIGRLAPAGSS
jgi:chromosome partitioning protein